MRGTKKAILKTEPELRYKISLARELNMTLGELDGRMSSRELTLQMAYDSVLEAEAEHAAKEMK